MYVRKTQVLHVYVRLQNFTIEIYWARYEIDLSGIGDIQNLT